jgi:hypothetical protein
MRGCPSERKKESSIHYELMKKKYSFSDALHHTQMVVSGQKKVALIPAPHLRVAATAVNAAGEYAVQTGERIAGIVATDRLLFITSAGKLIADYAMPLAVGGVYEVPQRMRDIHPELSTAEGRAKFGGAWDSASHVRVGESRLRVRVDSIDYRSIADVTPAEAIECGLDIQTVGGESCAVGGFEAVLAWKKWACQGYSVANSNLWSFKWHSKRLKPMTLCDALSTQLHMEFKREFLHGMVPGALRSGWRPDAGAAATADDYVYVVKFTRLAADGAVNAEGANTKADKGSAQA